MGLLLKAGLHMANEDHGLLGRPQLKNIYKYLFSIKLTREGPLILGVFGIAFRRPKSAFKIIEKINYKYKKI
jgi:hypothetical protein